MSIRDHAHLSTILVDFRVRSSGQLDFTRDVIDISPETLDRLTAIQQTHVTMKRQHILLFSQPKGRRDFIPQDAKGRAVRLRGRKAFVCIPGRVFLFNKFLKLSIDPW